jgi:molybdopterin molybdotransferase
VLPVRVLPSGEVAPATPLGRAPGGGGHLVSALLAADGLALVPASSEKVEAGDDVAVVDLGGPE